MVPVLVTSQGRLIAHAASGDSPHVVVKMRPASSPLTSTTGEPEDPPRMPAQRKDYYRIKSGAWTQLVRHAVYELSALRKLAERGLELMDEQHTELIGKLQDAADLFGYLEREYPLLIDRWEREHKK